MRFDAIRRMWERLRASGGKSEVLDTDSFTDSERAVGRLVLPLIADFEAARQTISDLSSRTRALAVALDLLPVAAIVLDGSEHFITSNAQARKLFGGVGLPERILDASRSVMHSSEHDAIRVQLSDGRAARLVLAEAPTSAEAGDVRIVFIALEEQPAGTIDPRLLVNRLQLTPMQARVVALVSVGLSNREIAERLGLSTETVRKHLATAYARTGVNNRAGIVALAYDVRFGGASPISIQ
jgi:DNA-binding CsgD family transcriptional regulator